MKILILNPPSKTTKNYVRDLIYGSWCKGKRIGGAKSPPLNLLYVATVLKNDGHKIEFLDALAEQRTLNYVINYAKDCDVVIIPTSQMSFYEDINVLSALKENNQRIKTIVFGSQPTFFPEEALDKEVVDIIVKREAELAIRDFIKLFEKRNNGWKKVRGIGFKEGKKNIINPDYPFIDVNELPIPDRSLLPKKVDYFNPLIKRIPYTTAMTSRGCSGICTFCNVPNFYGKTDRCMTAERVIKEIKEIVKLGYKEIWFRDETFTAFPERNKKICEWIIKNKIDITWIANARINMITKDMMSLMKKAGCHMIKFGVESGVQCILNNVKKGITIEKTREVFKWAHEIGIDTHAHVMVGMPGDTKETIETTINFVKKIDPTTATFGICTPYAGTPLLNEVISKDPSIKDGSTLSKIQLHVEAYYNKCYTKVSDKDLKKYVKNAYRSFYFRPSYILKWLGRIKNVDELRRVVLAGANIFSFGVGKD